jgi:hypothetical protein
MKAVTQTLKKDDRKTASRRKKEPDIAIGDIGLETTNQFISRAIRYLLNIYRKLRGYKAKALYSHAFIFIEVWGQLHVAEAIRKGVVIRPFKIAYPDPARFKVKIKRPKKPYTKKEQEKLCKECLKAVMEPHPYDFLDLLAQVWLIFTGKWIGHRGRTAEGKYYCSEFVAFMTNKVRRYFDKPEQTNPYDVDDNSNFTVRYDYDPSSQDADCHPDLKK